jgi:hypothetical protein
VSTVDIEFLDPGPDQPDGPAQAAAAPPEAPRPRRVAREDIGLIVMLTAAVILPVVAAFQTVYTVRSGLDEVSFAYAADAWGRFSTSDGTTVGPGVHEARYGVLLTACGAGFAVLAVAVLLQALTRRPSAPRLSGPVIAGAAAAITGVLTGVSASMALQIETVVDRLRTSGADPFGGPRRIELGVGAAIWLSLAGLLAGGLAVAAALRARRLPPSGTWDGSPPEAVSAAAPGY